MRHFHALEGPALLSQSQSVLRFHRSWLTSQRRRALYSTAVAPTRLTLRPYQEESIQAVLDHLRRGQRRLGISLATGAGKTVIFSQLIGRVMPHHEKAQKTLILVHRRELVEQAARHCIGTYPDKNVEIDMGKMKASGQADITVASVQSLKPERLAKYDPAEYKLILVDEAHHIVAAAYLRILKYFGLIKDRPESTEKTQSDSEAPPKNASNVKDLPDAVTPALVGVSATFSRFDGLSLGHAIDKIVYHKDYVDLIGQNFLSNVVFSTVYLKVDLANVKSKADGDFLPSALSEAVNTETLNNATFRAWKERAGGGQRESTLGFCVDISHAETLAAKFRFNGVDARIVTGKTPPAARAQIIEAFRRKQFPVLLNVSVFTEGTDIPNIDCVLLARPTKSRNLLVQMIGRGMRLSPNKENCHVIDMVSALQTGIVTVPTLFGLDPTVLLEKASIDEIQQTKEKDPGSLEYVTGKEPAVSSTPYRLNYKNYDSVTDLIGASNKDAHIRALSNHNWVAIGPKAEANDRWILTGSGSANLTIHDLGDSVAPLPRFRVSETRLVPGMNASMLSKNNFRGLTRPRTVAKADTFADAVHAADTYADSSALYPRYLIDRAQAWRQKPATEKQIELLKRLLPKDSEVDPNDYTMGRIGDFIQKLKSGAKGQFNTIQSQQAKETRAKLKMEQIQQMREREVVRVGPVA